MKKAPIRRPSEFELSRFILGECTQKQKREVQTWIDSGIEATDEFKKFNKLITDINTPDTAFKFKPEKTFLFQELKSYFINRLLKPDKLVWGLVTTLLIIGVFYYYNHYSNFIPNISKFQNISITKQPTESGRLRDTLEIIINTCRSMMQQQQIRCDFSGVLEKPCMNRFHSFNQVIYNIESPLPPVKISSDRTSNHY